LKSQIFGRSLADFFLRFLNSIGCYGFSYGFSRKVDESEKGKQTPVPSPQKEIQRLGPMDLKIYSLEKTTL
jgi:hypothetical protein